jgi:hypothetical protein
VHLKGVEEMKEEALKLEDELPPVLWANPKTEIHGIVDVRAYPLEGFIPLCLKQDVDDMIRRLVEELDKHKETIRKLNKTLGFINSGYEVINLEPQTKLFTDDEIKEIVGSNGDGIGGYTRELFDKIEAKIKEKNVQKT